MSVHEAYGRPAVHYRATDRSSALANVRETVPKSGNVLTPTTRAANGQVEVFSVAAPPQFEALQTAAVTLASAVVERLFGQEQGQGASVCREADPDEDSAYAAFDRAIGTRVFDNGFHRQGLVRLRTEEITVEDF